MGIDHMGALRVCAKCKSRGDDVCWSQSLQFYVCDECFTDINDAKEDANITSCYPVND